MNRTFAATVAVSVLAFTNLWARDTKFLADNLKYSRDFYGKVHFVAKLPQSFKWDQGSLAGPHFLFSLGPQ